MSSDKSHDTGFDRSRLGHVGQLAGGNVYNYPSADDGDAGVWRTINWLVTDMQSLSQRVYWLTIAALISGTAALAVALITFVLVLSR